MINLLIIFITICRFSPGASPDVLTVGGTQRNDDLYLHRSARDGTNYGRCVDIFAPGQDITSAGISSRAAVATFRGTSQAAPLVSGAAAIYWSVNKMATPLEVKDAIISNCTRDRLNVDAVVPPSFQGQTPNCLLYIYPFPLQIVKNFVRNFVLKHFSTFSYSELLN